MEALFIFKGVDNPSTPLQKRKKNLKNKIKKTYNKQ